jgi:hypothetical protein
MFLGNKLPENIKKTVMHALGLSVIVVGLQMALSGKELVAVIACVLAGGVIGEVANIERTVKGIGGWLKHVFRSDSSTFIDGFVTASVLYLTGAMVIVGPIRDGTVGDPNVLFIKALLDGVASMAFASSMGVGVAFSAIPVLIVQGAITLLASKLLFLQDPNVLAAVTSSGGILILGIGINILGLTKIRVGNLIPAIFLAIIWALIYF